MIPVLVDGVKKYLLTEEEVDAKISASSGGSSSETMHPVYFNGGTLTGLPTDKKYVGSCAIFMVSQSSSSATYGIAIGRPYPSEDSCTATEWIEDSRWDVRLV